MASHEEHDFGTSPEERILGLDGEGMFWTERNLAPAINTVIAPAYNTNKALMEIQEQVQMPQESTLPLKEGDFVLYTELEDTRVGCVESLGSEFATITTLTGKIVLPIGNIQVFTTEEVIRMVDRYITIAGITQGYAD